MSGEAKRSEAESERSKNSMSMKAKRPGAKAIFYAVKEELRAAMAGFSARFSRQSLRGGGRGHGGRSARRARRPARGPARAPLAALVAAAAVYVVSAISAQGNESGYDMLCSSLAASAAYDGYVLSAELETRMAGGEASFLRYARYVGKEGGPQDAGPGTARPSPAQPGGGDAGEADGAGAKDAWRGEAGGGPGGDAPRLDKDAVSVGFAVAMSALDAALGLHKSRIAYEPAPQGDAGGGSDAGGRITLSLAGNQIPAFLSVGLPAISGIAARFGGGAAVGASASSNGSAAVGASASSSGGGRRFGGIAGDAFRAFLEAGGDSYTDEHLNFPLTRVSNTRFLCPTAICGRNPNRTRVYLPPLTITVERLDISALRTAENLLDSIGMSAVFTVADSQSKSYEVEFFARLGFTYL